VRQINEFAFLSHCTLLAVLGVSVPLLRDSALLGYSPSVLTERYHTPLGRSVTDSLLFGGAKRSFLALTAVRCAA
jgi:hypothetical protein